MHPRKKIVHIIFILIFSLGLIGPSTLSGRSAPARAHPHLQQVASQSPEQRVSVIVQTADEAAQLNELVNRLGGVITQELQIINAFVAEMDAGAALALASQPEGHWVNLDSPVTSQAINKEVVQLRPRQRLRPGVIDPARRHRS